MCRIPTADLWPSPLKIHVKEISFIGKLQGALFSQVFLKDIGLRCRKFIIQDKTFVDQLLVFACDVSDLFVFISYWDSHTLFQRSQMSQMCSLIFLDVGIPKKYFYFCKPYFIWKDLQTMYSHLNLKAIWKI